ncbi:MAG: LysR family transcriptional regulator [Roseobacter sp.]
MLIKGVTLRGLEVFEALASTGSVAQTAAQTGLSQPAVSQQLRNLEAALGTELVDHNRRPMRVTPAGSLFLARTQLALSELRTAQNELAVMDLADIKALSIGVIDDFDDKVTPRLSTMLADSLTECQLKIVTAPSHDLARLLQDKSLHITISANTGDAVDGVKEYPIAQDPFIIVAPRGVDFDLATLSTADALPFLRYEAEQHISAQIASALARNDLQFPERFEIGSHLALMAMVARGIGWAMTTPLGYMRAQRFHDDLQVLAWPFTPFDRQISVFAGEDWDAEVPKSVAETMRRLTRSHVIEPALAEMPFLSDTLRIIDATE